MSSSRDIASFFRNIIEASALILRKYFGEDYYSEIVGENISGDHSRRIDLIVEEYIVNSVKESGLKSWIISEERGAWKICDNPEFYVLVDPLDGSLNYALRIPFVSISLTVYGEPLDISKPLYGVVYNVFTGDRVELLDNEIYFNDTRINTPLGKGLDVASIYVDDPFDLERIIEILRNKYNVSIKTRTMGSASIEATYTAMGLIGHFIHITGRLRNSDIALGLAIASKLGRRLYTNPPLNNIRVDSIQIIKKMIIGPRESPVFEIVK